MIYALFAALGGAFVTILWALDVYRREKRHWKHTEDIIAFFQDPSPTRLNKTTIKMSRSALHAAIEHEREK